MPTLNSEVPQNGLGNATTAYTSTTTLYRAPAYTGGGVSEGDGPRVPIAAIAGGVVAGAILAIMVTIGWIWWGRSLDRSAAKERRAAATRYNTVRNANISRPRAQTVRPSTKGSGRTRMLGKQVKFANSEQESEGLEEGRDVHIPQPTRAQRFKAMKGMTRFQSVEKREAAAAAAIQHQPSRQTMSSMSEYSTASGEARGHLRPQHSLLSALGLRGSSSREGSLQQQQEGQRWSWTSTRPRAHRSSQFTEQSQTTEGSGRVVVMGVAL